MHRRKGSNLAKVLPAVSGAHVHLGALTGTMWALGFRIWTLGAIRIICWVVLGLGLCISVTHLTPLFPKELLSNWFLAPSNSFVGCLVFFSSFVGTHLCQGNWLLWLWNQFLRCSCSTNQKSLLWAVYSVRYVVSRQNPLWIQNELKTNITLAPRNIGDLHFLLNLPFTGRLQTWAVLVRLYMLYLNNGQ